MMFTLEDIANPADDSYLAESPANAIRVQKVLVALISIENSLCHHGLYFPLTDKEISRRNESRLWRSRLSNERVWLIHYLRACQFAFGDDYENGCIIECIRDHQENIKAKFF